jgi:putative ATP-binding cassette transporter
MIRLVAGVSKAFFVSGNKRETRVLVAVILFLCLLVGAWQVLISYAGRNFMTSLAQRDSAGFYRNLWVYLATFAVAVPIGVFYRYAAERLSLRWREWMTRVLVRRYFFNHAYYRLRSSNQVDNPDQRIAEDLRLFTSGSLGFALGLLRETTTLASFVGILWMVSGPLDFTLGDHSYSIPGYMLWGALLYALIGSSLTWWIGRPLIGLNFRQEQLEADFRFNLVRMREYAEGVALYHGEATELQGHATRLQRLRQAEPIALQG